MTTKIRVQCACGKAYRIPDPAVGRKATCRGCGNRFRVEADGTTSRVPPRVESPEPLTVELPEVTVPLRSRRRAARPIAAGIAALVLVAAGGITLAVTVSRPKPPLEYVPAGTSVVLRIDTRRAFETLCSQQEIEEIIRESGVDPTRDVEAVYLAIDVSPDAAPEVLVLIEGRLDLAGLLADPKFKERVFVETSYRGHRLLSSSGSSLSEDPVAAAVLRPGLLAYGSEEMLRRSIDASEGEADCILDDATLGDLVGRADADALAWCAVHLPEEAKEGLPAGAQGLQSVLISVDEAEGAFTLGATCRFETEAQAGSAAREIESALDGGPGSSAIASTLPDGMVLGGSIESAGRQLDVELSLDAVRAREMLESFRELGRGSEADGGGDPRDRSSGPGRS